jgi:hypothetical protein
MSLHPGTAGVGVKRILAGGRAAHGGDPRIDAYVAGWREAVLEVLTQQEALLKRDRAAFERFKHSVDCLMPHDFGAPDLLDLKRPRDAA